MNNLRNDQLSLTEKLKDEQKRMSVRYKSNARHNIIPGLQILLDQKTPVTYSDHAIRKELLRIYFNCQLILGLSIDDAYCITKAANAQLVKPLNTYEFDEIIKFPDKIYTYNPDTVEIKLQLSQYEIDLAGMTQAAKKRKADRERARERRRKVFHFRQDIVVLYLNGITDPPEIYNHLSKDMQREFTQRAVRDFIRDLRLNKRNPNPRDLEKEPISSRELVTHDYS